MRRLCFVSVVSFCALACDGLTRKPPPDAVRVVFDPDAHRIPLPTDVLRDPSAGHLDLPVDDDNLNDAEREFFTYMNTLDGWSTSMQANAEFSSPIDPASITFDTVQVWDFTQMPPKRVAGVLPVLDSSGTRLTIDPPRTGWVRGARYVVLVLGGDKGIKGAHGEPVMADAAFYFLRLNQQVNTPEHEHAFPGDTHAQRMAKADKAEKARKRLADYFDWFEQNGVARTDVVALSPFTITTRVELAMDKATQRMPLPFDLLLDPKTGHVDVPAAAWDSPTKVEAKQRLKEYDGFSTMAHQTFDFTGPVDPTTVNENSVALYDLSGPAPRRVPAAVSMLADNMHVVIAPKQVQPLSERTRYAVVVSSTIRDAAGLPVSIMPIGHFMRAKSSILDADGHSRLYPIEDGDAVKVDKAHAEIAPVLDGMGRDGVLTAWPFTTMSILQPLRDAISSAERVGTSPDPKDITHMTTSEAASDFLLASLTLTNVKEVWNGTIESPVYLDPVTRGRRADGGYEVQRIGFTMSIPKSAVPGQPLPVVVFGHGLMAERRFVLSIADGLAQKGYAGISIDFPYHGSRTSCVWSGPLCLPDPLSSDGHEICPNPCESGSTCAPDGRCVDPSGQGNHLAKWPVVGFPQASGMAFVEVAHIANTKDHFMQALIDMGALTRSLRKGNWMQAIGYPIETANIRITGQSLGGIVGATYSAVDDQVREAVLNVPGGDAVDLYANSPTFGHAVTDFLAQEMITKGSGDEEQFMNVGRWINDATDPDNVAYLLTGKKVMIQMATLDFIIPNPYTERLAQIAGVPRRDYVAEHAFIVIPVEPEYPRGVSELTGFLAGSFQP